jgi:hypothetical protein
VKSFSHILIISGKSECSDVIRKIAERRLDKSNVFRVGEPAEGLSILNKIGVVDTEIPVCIFLSNEMEQSKVKAFLNLLDKDYPDASRGRVVLVNSRLRLNSIMQFAVSDAVGQFINCPVLPIEVESLLRRNDTAVGMIA